MLSEELCLFIYYVITVMGEKKKDTCLERFLYFSV